MLQNQLKPKAWSVKKRMRVWRWDASKWRTCWRWDKWQNSRKSWWVSALFEWWQTPLHKRLPKLKWFNNKTKVYYQVINVKDLDAFDWQDVKIETLMKANLISNKKLPCKVLWDWEIKAKVKLFINKASQIAKSKIEKAWGTIELI